MRKKKFLSHLHKSPYYNVSLLYNLYEINYKVYSVSGNVGCVQVQGSKQSGTADAAVPAAACGVFAPAKKGKRSRYSNFRERDSLCT